MYSSDAKELSEKVAQLLEAGNSAAVLSLLKQLASERDNLAIQREQLAGERDKLTTQRDALRTRVERRDIEISRLRQLLYGRKSEKLTREELSQLVLSFGATDAEAAEEDPNLPIPALTDAEPEEGSNPKKKRRPNHHGRGAVSPNVERLVTEVAVPEDERVCNQCGEEMVAFGYIDHELVEYVPPKVVVHVERCEKLGCKCWSGAASHNRRASSM